jgi:hypothetical protein
MQKAVLHKIEHQKLLPRQLQTLRAIETLEVIATPAARQLLETLAQTAPGTIQQIDAAAALRRLERMASVRQLDP